MIVDEKKVKNCKIVQSHFEELRSLMHKLVKIKSGKHYKLLIIHKKRLTHIILIEMKKKLGSLIAYIN